MLTKYLSVHHIGGRDGSRAFPLVDQFEKDVINVLYDADPNCIAQIKKRNGRLPSQLHVLPYCFADRCKAVSLNINYDPYTSSLHDTNPHYDSYYLFYCDYDYVWGEATLAKEKKILEAVNVDHVMKKENKTIPPPDFLSVDTQGSEHEILLGAEKTLSNVLALVVEVEFHPLYQGQKLAGDLIELLSRKGFHFVRFQHFFNMSPYRCPHGLRGEGFQMSADALFVRRIDAIEETVADEAQRQLMLKKLAFAAIVFNLFEYGIECLCRVDFDDCPCPDGPRYLEFLHELKKEADKMPPCYPATFAGKYSFEWSKARFEVCAPRLEDKKPSFIDRIKPFLRRLPVVYSLLKGVKRSALLVFSGRTRGAQRKSSSPESFSAVENLLLKYGLKQQAQVLLEKRLAEADFCIPRPAGDRQRDCA